MSLDQPSSIPVDTHMFKIASAKYLPHLKKFKSVTDKVYREIGDHFRKLYGEHAGWAHSVWSEFVLEKSIQPSFFHGFRSCSALT